MRRDNTKGKIQRTILHYLSWRGMAASLAMAALPATAAEPDSLAIDTMSYDLGEVTVTAQRKLVKNDIDKLTYDVANDETARTKNTLDMLRSVPLVTIDGQENISIKGSPSFKVYRNGHPDPTLSSQNLKDVLKSIPASQIKKVEVITDPGAKEDAEGTQYILNLVMQNNSHLAGVTGTVSANYNPLRQGPGMGTMLTIQKGKLATSINYGYQHDKKDQGNDATRQYLKTDQTMESRSRNTVMTNVHYGNISASYEVDSLNLLTLNFGGYYYNAGIGSVNGYERMTNGDGQLAYFYNVNAQLPTYYAYNFGGRLDYQHKTRKEGEVFTASYQLQTTRSHQDKTAQYLNIFNLPVSYTGYENNSRTQFDEHTFQLDYVRPLGKWFKWNAGAKYIFRTSESDVWLTYTGAEEMNQHSLFQHNTQIAAAYTEWLYSGSKIQARVGLRYEYSFLKAEYPDGSQSDFHKRLNDWVPSASVRYALTDAQSLKLSFSSNINRPGIDYLNPAEERNPNSLSYGNPGLNSSRNYNLQSTTTSRPRLPGWVASAIRSATTRSDSCGLTKTASPSRPMATFSTAVAGCSGPTCRPPFGEAPTWVEVPTFSISPRRTARRGLSIADGAAGTPSTSPKSCPGNSPSASTEASISATRWRASIPTPSLPTTGMPRSAVPSSRKTVCRYACRQATSLAQTCAPIPPTPSRATSVAPRHGWAHNDM